MKIKHTNRGFQLIEFTDGNGKECSLQESSAAERPMIWLGCDDADPRVGPPWKKLEVPPNALFNTRMHLTQKQVKKLLPHLIKFAAKGGL